MRSFTLVSAAAAAVLIAFAVHAAPAAKLADKYAQNGDVKIHYVVEGKGPLVVMVHGFPDYWATWKPLMAELSAAGYRTAAMDTRGYNLSDKPAGEAAYAMPNLVGDVAAVIAAEGQKKAIVIGHDWGAAISWRVAMDRPDVVDKLIIMAVPHPAGMARELASNKDQQANSQYARNFQKPGSEKMLTAEGLAGWVKDPAEKPGYVEAFKRSDFAAMMNYYRANYPKGTGAAHAADQGSGPDHPRHAGQGAERRRPRWNLGPCHGRHHHPDDPHRRPLRTARRRSPGRPHGEGLAQRAAVTSCFAKARSWTGS
jgi:pimeloyl-ACP methyl ester carboxylesterase